MKRRQKALVWFLFLFFPAFSQLNISWKFELTTFLFSLFTKVSSLIVIIFNICGKTVIRLVFLFVSTIWTVKYCTKIGIFKFSFLFRFAIIFSSLSSRPLSARPLFLIVLHNGVKKNSRVKGVICYLYRNGEFGSDSIIFWRFMRILWKDNIDRTALSFMIFCRTPVSPGKFTFFL